MPSPTCPACGCKFPFANGDHCVSCNLPRNIATQGAAAISRWKQGKYLGDQSEQPTRQFKHGAAASKTRRRRKHGRQHASR